MQSPKPNPHYARLPPLTVVLPGVPAAPRVRGDLWRDDQPVALPSVAAADCRRHMQLNSHATDTVPSYMTSAKASGRMESGPYHAPPCTMPPAPLEPNVNVPAPAPSVSAICLAANASAGAYAATATPSFTRRTPPLYTSAPPPPPPLSAPASSPSASPSFYMASAPRAAASAGVCATPITSTCMSAGALQLVPLADTYATHPIATDASNLSVAESYHTAPVVSSPNLFGSYTGSDTDGMGRHSSARSSSGTSTPMRRSSPYHPSAPYLGGLYGTSVSAGMDDSLVDDGGDPQLVEKRRRNARASARFRDRRKQREREMRYRCEQLEQRVMHLESLLARSDVGNVQLEMEHWRVEAERQAARVRELETKLSQSQQARCAIPNTVQHVPQAGMFQRTPESP
ncbi:hypothetical protein THASP1DRAFT_21963 [Thamnocephalis sphaerospora]|uniref:BZIP domain-containing protein n=1 Tax=Thamnocephalis sphaerospora TaxID=78915 RepID=A0A4P9XVJ9_9FUNG|nr:hypothetical protein THASP1DRAFT_21963 [Thamnocephalis sphaerospora]|eukprot:RKP10314.1 hypothetical protein THASP1DRAFT_21963 [Thamnocephalis sphaerospora]